MISIDYIQGHAFECPKCAKCDSILRPNIQLKNDLDFQEKVLNKELLSFEEFIKKNKRRSMVILELGAGPT